MKPREFTGAGGGRFVEFDPEEQADHHSEPSATSPAS